MMYRPIKSNNYKSQTTAAAADLLCMILVEDAEKTVYIHTCVMCIYMCTYKEYIHIIYYYKLYLLVTLTRGLPPF